MPDQMPIPNGWFAVAFSDVVKPGQAVAAKAFGQELAIWRAEDGTVTVMDAHCPHLGAHLGVGGVVRGGTIACPFHGWTFDCAGTLLDVPYEKAKPVAQQRVWPSSEQNGMILIWHHAQGVAPFWSMVRFEDEGWTPNATCEWIIRSHPQDICENGMDVAHLKFIHRSNGRQLTDAALVSDTVLRLEVSLPTDLDPASPAEDRLINEVHGPGLVLAHLRSTALNGLFRLYSTPLGDGTIALRGMISIKTAPGFDNDNLQQFMAASVSEQWEQDLPIWENKIIRTKPMLTRSEGAIGTYRRWYQRFYEDRWGTG